MKISLGVLDFSSHINFMIDFCEAAMQEFDLTVFTSPEEYEKLSTHVDTDMINWVLRYNSESLGAFLSRVEHHSEQLDALWLFPIYGNLIDFAKYARFSPRTETILLVYNTNTWLGRGFSPILKVYNYLKFPLRRSILSEVDTVVTEYDPIQQYVEQHNSNLSVETFTPIIFRPDHDLTTNWEEVTYTIPGNIERSRRDYMEILDAYERLPEEVKKEIRLLLLGQPEGEYGRKIINRCDSLREQGGKITYYEDWIPTEEFTQQILKSDFLLSPLKKQKTVDGFIEIYGQTKGSGVVGDGIRSATPVILPEWYSVPSELTDLIHLYVSASDLCQLMQEHVSDPDQRESIKNNTRTIAEMYAAPKQADRLRRLVENILNSSV